MKFNNEKSWSAGENFGVENEDPKGYGEYPAGGSNLKVADTGYYLVIVSCTLSADKKSINRKVILAEPKLFLRGACAGGWQMQVQVDRMIRKLLSPCRQMALLMRP